MQTQYVGSWIKGFYRIASYALKHDIEMKQQEEIKKLENLKFCEIVHAARRLCVKDITLKPCFKRCEGRNPEDTSPLAGAVI